MAKLGPFAEDLNYWNSSTAGADSWLGKAEDLIGKYGGEVSASGSGMSGGKQAVMLEFEFGDERYRLVWPALASKYEAHDGTMKFRRSAMRQAATMVYHEVKAAAVRFRVAGPRFAFFNYLVLPNGQVVGELAAPDLLKAAPKMLTSGAKR